MNPIRKPKLELTWIGKENRPRLEPRILLEDPAKSHHAKHRVTDKDLFDNRLISGDNLLALKALGWWAVDKIRDIRSFLCKLALRLAARYNTFSSTHAPCLSSARMMHIKGAFFYFPIAMSRGGESQP